MRSTLLVTALLACAFATPAAAEDVIGTTAVGVKLGVVDDPQTVAGTHRIYALDWDSALGGRRWLLGMNFGIGGGSGGGVFYRTEMDVGPRIVTPSLSAAVWGSLGFDGLTERLTFSLKLGAGAHVRIGTPLRLLELAGRVHLRGKKDPMDPDAESDSGAVYRGRAALYLTHQRPPDEEAIGLGPVIAFEVEQIRDARIFWIMFGSGLSFGPR